MAKRNRHFRIGVRMRHLLRPPAAFWPESVAPGSVPILFADHLESHDALVAGPRPCTHAHSAFANHGKPVRNDCVSGISDMRFLRYAAPSIPTHWRMSTEPSRRRRGSTTNTSRPVIASRPVKGLHLCATASFTAPPGHPSRVAIPYRLFSTHTLPPPKLRQGGIRLEWALPPPNHAAIARTQWILC